MNEIETIQVDYIKRASRTLETILLTKKMTKDQKVVYLYNYEGVHFRIFEDIFEFANFYHEQPYKVLKEYSKEKYVDNFLANYHFVI